MRKFLMVFMLSMITTSLFAGTAKKENKRMDQVIRDYALGADTGNSKLIEKSF